MKAVVYEKYGPPDVLQLKEVDKAAPRDHEVLIRVHATTVTAADGLMRRGDSLISRLFLGLRKPRRKVLGSELAGEIEAAGKDVTEFRVGERVYGFTGFGLGAYAEYACMPEQGSLALMPANLTYEEAAAVVDGASTAWFFLRDKANLQSGQKILVNGASGSIGTYAVQLARYFGAEVTGVCSARNVELVKSLGAAKVIDYTQEDFTESGETYDVIFDTVGKTSFSRCKGSLRKDGRYLMAVGRLTDYALVLWTSLAGSKKVVWAMSLDKRESLISLKALIEAGTIRPVIDRRYPLEAMAEAHRYVEQGHKTGNVVITLNPDNTA